MKIIKWVLIVLGVLLLLALGAIYFMSEEKPQGKGGDEADQLAQKMLDAINYDAFKQTRYINWSFAGRNTYFYDQQANKALIEWDKNSVLLNLDSQTGKSFVDGVNQEGKAHQALIEKAWSNWCNDSFWMLAPFKVFDPGTKRSIVQEEGQDALMVEYVSGGVTPGDSYLWILNDQNIPTGYKMWTSILPVKGMYASWEEWKEFNGAKYSTMHKLGASLEMKNFMASNDLADFGRDKNPFE